RAELKKHGCTFQGHSDTEVLLLSFIQWGEKCLDKLNGIFAFAIWNDKTKRLFAARDRMGVKPFFYKKADDGIIFASELKSLFKNPNCPAILDKHGINQMFLLGPGRIPGSGVFVDIKELRPGEFLWLDKQGLEIKKYFSLKAKKHTQTFDETVETLKDLVLDSIDRQLVSDVPLACFLSGGLDSSIISYAASKKYKAEGNTLSTYSVDFQGNDKNFVKSKFQPDSDAKYIKQMVDVLGTNHKNIILENDDVVTALKEAALARDLPGMGDIDSSLLLFSREVKKQHTVCLSGECADELFGGYPWFFDGRSKEEVFPWSRSIDLRKKLINPKFLVENPEKFVHDCYIETTKNVDTLPTDSEKDIHARKMFMLNIQWFMQTLLDRKDRMTMYCGLEVRVPFCDHRLAEYAYNIPWETKAYQGREKGLLREAFKDILPNEIVYRKKSPYPKTFDSKFFEMTKEGATKAINKGGLLSKLVNREYFDYLLTLPPEQAEPWYGQLMRLPQIFAFLMQLDYILQEYQVKLLGY
ncbi:MAG: asparagine synthase (glutamine-hydrolyzing), partial [Firmicutes bacterium]|nr:asparagine synthase (glutamine-hydrolyzing) [Bacillota bacterium]